MLSFLLRLGLLSNLLHPSAPKFVGIGYACLSCHIELFKLIDSVRIAHIGAGSLVVLLDIEPQRTNLAAFIGDVQGVQLFILQSLHGGDY